MCLHLFGLRSNTSASQNGEAASNREEQADAPSRLPRSFSVVVYVVTAAKRFQAALNPTVKFKKRNTEEDRLIGISRRSFSDGTALQALSLESQKTLKNMETFKRTTTDRLVPRQTFGRRGHMTGYLFKPLAEVRTTS